MGVVRSYGQYCSISRALDVVGERWTLLVVRELLLRGPCRFTDLRNGLPGVATNLLSSRLKELEEAGIVTREEAPPPVATVLYALTPAGEALAPVLRSLGSWGLHLMAEEKAGDAVQPHWLTYAVEWFSAVDPGGPPTIIQLDVDGIAAVVDITDGVVRARTGRAEKADLTIAGPPRAVLGLLLGMFDIRAAEQLGLTLTGSR
ncbi:MAG TPA: helix-turn-helix domain-containing protein, partial [Nocardioides sp.]